MEHHRGFEHTKQVASSAVVDGTSSGPVPSADSSPDIAPSRSCSNRSILNTFVSMESHDAVSHSSSLVDSSTSGSIGPYASWAVEMKYAGVGG